MKKADIAFTGSVPELYDRYMVPLIFEPYAADLVRRVAPIPATRLLEVAAGTGVVTRALASSLGVDIVATDLNQAMLDRAAAVGTARPVTWQAADVMRLPFRDSEFDIVVCQFGVMFFPDKAKAFAEIRRVLRPGGTFLFNTWDRLEANVFAHEVTNALATLFPEDPPRFMARVPHGYFDVDVLRRDLAAGGFTSPPHVETISARSVASSARVPAVALCQGTPVRGEIEARRSVSLDDATHAAEQALVRRFGAGRVEGQIQAHVVTVTSSPR